MAETWVFWILAPVSLGAAIAMVLMRNAVHGALMLVVNLFTIAVFYAVLEAQFLAVIQLIVYAGAIMVLFLFVLMLLGVHRDDTLTSRIRGQKPAAVLLGLALLMVLVAAVAGPYLGPAAVCGLDPGAVAEAGRGRACVGLAAANQPGNVEALGGLLFTRYVWPFEVMSVLLVIAALGAMVLGRRREQPEELVDVLAAPPSVAAEEQPGPTAEEQPGSTEEEQPGSTEEEQPGSTEEDQPGSTEEEQS